MRSLLPKREQLFDKYGLDSSRKTLLFVSSFVLIGLPKSEPGNDYQQEETREYIYDVTEKSQKIILEWWEQLCREYPDIQVIYRPHPAESKNPAIQCIADRLDNFYVIADESIKKWISTCDALYNWQSTSMIEMYASGKPTFLLRPVHISTDYDLPYYVEGNYTEINQYKDLVESLQKSEGNVAFPIPDRDLLPIYSITDEPAYKRIGDYLIQTLFDHNYYSRPVKKTLFDMSEGENERCDISIRIKRVLRSNHMFQVACHYIAPRMGNSTLGNRIKKIDREVSEKKKQNQVAESLDNMASKEYHMQKMYQNRASSEEIRAQIDQYKAILH